MRNYLSVILLFAALMLGACAQPYKGLMKMEFNELQYPYPVKMADLGDGIRLAYVDEGKSEEPILFLHGLGSYLPAWQKNIRDLRDQFRCIAVDLPGYGKSSKGLFPFTMEFYADVIVKFMDALNIPRATIAGHSMGGQIAMVMALKYPERVSRLILVSPAGFELFTPGEKAWLKEVMTPEFVQLTPVQQIRANVVSNFYNMPKDAEFMVTDRIALRDARDFLKYCYAVSKSVAGMVDQPVFEVLEKISQPTLILFGENDNLIPNRILHGGRTRDIAEIGHAKIPNSRLVMIPRCGHFLQFEKPEIFNQAITRFLKDTR